MLRTIILGLCLMNMVSFSPTTTMLFEFDTTPAYSITEVSPRADIIITKYRTYNGIKQKRRWNESKQRWVDPYWINVY